MERDIVYKNLHVIKDAVNQNQEILVDLKDQDLLMLSSKESYNNISDHQRKDRTKFVISKTIAYCPSVLERDSEIRDLLYSMATQLVDYFKNRSMGPLADLMNQMIQNEVNKDSWYQDYSQKKID